MADTPFQSSYVGAQKMAKKPKNWIKKATSKNKGKFKAAAKAAGYTTREYATKKAKAPGKLGREARLAKTLMSLKGTLAE